jgi:hypothetical protein
VSLGDGYVLSAGHGMIEKGFPVSQEEISCMTVGIEGLNQDQPYQTISSANVARNNGFADDLAMYKISDTDQQYITNGAGPFTHGPEVSATPVQLGDTVYFSNWQPTDKNAERSPLASSELDTPAVYPGVVIGVGDVLTVSTDITSLGKGAPDQNVRPGASGGEVLNAKGEIIGLSNGMYDSAAQGALHSLFRRLSNMHIGPFGLPGNGERVADITPITPDTVAALREQISTTPTC